MTDHLVTASTAATELADESAPVDRPTAVDEVVVLDYGGQYSQLIARRVRECGVFSELLPHHVGVEEVRRRRPKGLILSGGPASVYAEGAPKLEPELLELGIPVLGYRTDTLPLFYSAAGGPPVSARVEHRFNTVDASPFTSTPLHSFGTASGPNCFSILNFARRSASP